MTIKFSKYHGCGNDFICLDARGLATDFVGMAKHWCRRGFSVGADGLVLVDDSTVADYKMIIVNADGSIPEMCGNGLRCFAAYLIDQDITSKKQLLIETGAGILGVSLTDNGFPTKSIALQMGAAAILSDLPKSDFAFDPLQASFEVSINNEIMTFFPVSMGNPHCVIFVDDVTAVDVAGIGSFIEQHDFFPNRVNVEFVSLSSNTECDVRVWERGVGETNACGTGACAAVVAAVTQRQTHSAMTVRLRGGYLFVQYDQKTQQVTLEGPAEFVFQSDFVLS
jgi:diaminopimelate epimerase